MVVALALVFFALHYLPIVYQSAPLLVLGRLLLVDETNEFVVDQSSPYCEGLTCSPASA